MSWGSDWKTPSVWPNTDHTGKAISKAQAEAAKQEFKIINDSMQKIGKSLEAKFTDEEAAKLKEIWENTKTDVKAWPEFKNKHPTHDPYTNPGAFLYYECSCGQVLDPKVKSFASLNNAAMNAGWKVRWGPNSYVPYCVKCGEGVE